MYGTSWNAFDYLLCETTRNSGFQIVHVMVYNGFTSRWRPIDKYKQIIIMNFNRQNFKCNIMVILLYTNFNIYDLNKVHNKFKFQPYRTE